MPRKKIDCEECGFFGTLSYQDEDCTFSSITHCPICGFDLSEGVSEEDFDTEFD